MKRSTELKWKRLNGAKWFFLAVLIASVTDASAQDNKTVTGTLIDSKTNLAVPYTNVVLTKTTDPTPYRGTISNENGVFNLTQVSNGSYKLSVSMIGYKTVVKNINIDNQDRTDLGIIVLQDTSIMMNEVVATSERVKAKAEDNKTTFFISKKILDASNSGSDVLKLIPGIQMDLGQNISLQGSRNIQILVDGKERDANFINQLNPHSIEKIEIINKPSSSYDGNVTGAINIILKKDQNSGLSGRFNAEIPTGKEVFIRPSYSLNYKFKKVSIYSSYSGSLTYLDLQEKNYRKISGIANPVEISTIQNVKQKDWSHRFNYGFDYYINSNNEIDFYAFYNPYSRELDGVAESRLTGDLNNYMKAKKEDTDENASAFYSVYYKHKFKREGNQITFDLNYYSLTTKNATVYTSTEDENKVILQNLINPYQHSTSIKMDYTDNSRSKLNFSAGVKARFMSQNDKILNEFVYNENVLAAYGAMTYKNKNYDVSLSLRSEKSVSTLKGKFRNQGLSFFPNTSFRYKIDTRQNIRLSYSRSIRRPNMYQLNPGSSLDDPYSTSMGNPFLKPEYFNSINLEHTIQFKSNYLATHLFYNKFSDRIDNLTYVNESGDFETKVYNAGIINQFGVQLLGTLKVGIATFNPYVRLFQQYTSVNKQAEIHNVENRQGLTFASGFSTVVAFKYNWTLSFVYQYSSPQYNIQGNTYSDGLYSFTLEKAIKQKIKLGIVSILPFTRSFTYNGSEIKGANLYSRYDGEVLMTSVPVWFSISYQLNSGKSTEKTNRASEDISNVRKKGF